MCLRLRETRSGKRVGAASRCLRTVGRWQQFRPVSYSAHGSGTRLSVKITPQQVSTPTQRVTFRARGFDAGKALYVHYITPHRHILKPRRLGHLNGPCGTLTVTAPLIPGAAPPSGRWRLRFDSLRRYTQKTRPQVRITVRVG